MNIYEKELINEFFQDIRIFKKNVLEKTNNIFNISFIKYIKDEEGNNIGTKRFTLEKSFLGKNLDKVIFNNKIYYKNRNRFENIYISLNDKNKKTNLLWLDDVKLENFTEEQLKYMTLIETSPNNYQGYIILDKELTKNELKQVKLYFCNKYGTDRGSVDFTHLMRLPYFYSYKHKIPFLVNVKQYQTKILPIQPILNKIKKQLQTKSTNIYIYKYDDHDHHIDHDIDLDEQTLKKFYNIYFEKKMEEFKEAQKLLEEEMKNNPKIKKSEKPRQDPNVIDFRFIHFLHNFLKIDITKIKFENILYDIENRKKGHVEDYINRTIDKILNPHKYILDPENKKTYENYNNKDIELLNELLKQIL